MRQRTKRASSVVLITALFAVGGVASPAGVNAAGAPSAACKKAKRDLKIAQKQRKSPKTIAKLQAKVRRYCK